MSTVRQLSLKLMPESGTADNDAEHLLLLDSWVIGTLNELATAWDWECLKRSETITTVPSQAEYSLAVESASIVFARTPVDDQPIDIVTEQWLKDYGYDLELEGTLLAIYSSGYDTATKQSKIKCFYIPSEVVDIEIQEKLRIDEETMNGDSEIPFPTDFNECIKWGVRAKIADYRLKFGPMQMFMKKYEETLEMLKGNITFNIGERFVRGVCDIPQRRRFGLQRDPAHYRDDF